MARRCNRFVVSLATSAPKEIGVSIVVPRSLYSYRKFYILRHHYSQSHRCSALFVLVSKRRHVLEALEMATSTPVGLSWRLDTVSATVRSIDVRLGRYIDAEGLLILPSNGTFTHHSRILFETNILSTHQRPVSLQVQYYGKILTAYVLYRIYLDDPSAPGAKRS
ncbi:hypothetical protein NEOLEDRAFT_194081 [Neolentinus lepideus HHB14362 ss-1]|uniref:Uncharacterized protein n=1 Tax=Neolentinus lepideus HHB14362 ss-1 TaxID=1314782 RepID=A0A165MFJ2_9AGAM|nr:hypothetical protein NEOLEDRAFT_194081 [Neolentinus lepideus HHB14362 ss-1]